MLICNIFPFFVLNTERQTKDDENVKTDYDATITCIVYTLETNSYYLTYERQKIY